MVTSYWRPTTAHIRRLESELVTYLASRVVNGERVSANNVYHRQYIGIVLGARQLVYGDFYPDGFGPKFDGAVRRVDFVAVCPASWLHARGDQNPLSGLLAHALR